MDDTFVLILIKKKGCKMSELETVCRNIFRAGFANYGSIHAIISCVQFIDYILLSNSNSDLDSECFQKLKQQFISTYGTIAVKNVKHLNNGLEDLIGREEEYNENYPYKILATYYV